MSISHYWKITKNCASEKTIISETSYTISDHLLKLILLFFQDHDSLIAFPWNAKFIRESHADWLSTALCKYFSSIRVFFHKHSRSAGQQGQNEAISLTSFCHLHLLYRHLDISWVIAAESSPLHVASSQARAGKLLPAGASC